MLTPELMLAMGLLGLAAGVIGGLLGIAGSMLMVPGMDLLLGPKQFHLHQAAAMLVNAFVVGPAVWQHRRAGAIDEHVVRWTIPGAIAGGLIGVFISNRQLFRGAGQGWLQLLFAALLVYTVFDHVRRLLRPRPPMTADELARPQRRHSPLLLLAAVGLPTGALGGLLGVGGGLVAVPIQQLLLGIRLRPAIANSAATIIFSSAIAAVAKNASLGVHGLSFRASATLALLLIPGAMIGGWIGGHWVHRLPVRLIRGLFVVLLSIAIVQLVQSARQNLGGAL